MDRVVIVTGASAGIGLACSNRLAKAGWTVIGTSRRGSSPGGWEPMVMDVSDDAQVEEGVAKVLHDHGRLDAVVVCAGWGLAGPVEDTPIADAKDQFDTNFWGAVRIVRSALPVMRSQRSGRVVLVGSLGGLIALPFQAFYSASKFAMEGYAEALAYEVAPFGIQVTIVEPGNIKTEFTANRRQIDLSAGEGNYRAAFEKAISVMERDEADGAPPELVARTVENVLESKRPPRRVSVGKAGERIGVVAKRLLPHRLFEAAAKGALGV